MLDFVDFIVIIWALYTLYSNYRDRLDILNHDRNSGIVSARSQTIALWMSRRIWIGCSVMLVIIGFTFYRGMSTNPVWTLVGWVLVAVFAIQFFLLQRHVNYLIERPQGYWIDRPLPRKHQL